MKVLPPCILVLLAVSPLAATQIRFTNFDQNHSTIGFAVPIAGGVSEVDGKFTAFSADLLYDDQDISQSSVSVVIQAASINTGIPDRDEDLRSPRFFDTAKFPEIRFSSKRVTKQGDTVIVSGTLEMHGVTKPLDLVCRLSELRSDQKTGKLFIGGSATTTLNRRDFGINWEHTVPGFVGDQITISIHFISKLTPKPGPTQPAGSPGASRAHHAAM